MEALELKRQSVARRPPWSPTGRAAPADVPERRRPRARRRLGAPLTDPTPRGAQHRIGEALGMTPFESVEHRRRNQRRRALK